MILKIPFAPTSAAAEPLRKCIERAADECGMSPYLAALVMSHFLEQVAEQVSANRLVRVPGFGVFGPLAWQPRKAGLAAYCYPAFSASRAFRRQVSICCSPSGAALEAVRRHRRHHHLSSRPDRRTSMPYKALQAFRDRIIAQARASGMDI